MTPSDESLVGVAVCPPAQQTAAKRGKPSLPPFFFAPASRNAADSAVYNSGSLLPDLTSAATRRMHRPWPYPRVVGHRGAGALAPANPLAAIRKSGTIGSCRGVFSLTRPA